MLKAHKAYLISVVLFTTLISLMICQSLIFNKASIGALIAIILIKTLPLLVFAKGLFQKQTRAIIWMCFVLLIYMLASVLYSFQPGLEGKFALAQTLLIVMLFASSLFHIRWAQKAA